MKFTKMHGAGNDFVIIENLDASIHRTALPEIARKLCCRKLSVGADGLMVVVAAENGGDYGMLFYNSDGSLGEMCGNGARCIARYGYDKGLAGDVQHIETTAGMVTGQRISQTEYQVRLNDPCNIRERVPCCVGGENYYPSYVELGKPGIPHAVLILDEWDKLERQKLFELGSALRYAPEFPKGANVSFVRFLGNDELKAVTFERGVEDFTLACGTGSGSIVTILSLMGLVSGDNVRVHMPGGTLSVSLTLTESGVKDIFLTGPATVVCCGEISPEVL